MEVHHLHVTTNIVLVVIRESLLADLGSVMDSIKHPSDLEARWIWSGLHQYVRQWHLMPHQSKLVNNALEDGRILNVVNVSTKISMAILT
jgi:hypothetical protein